MTLERLGNVHDALQSSLGKSERITKTDQFLPWTEEMQSRVREVSRNIPIEIDGLKKASDGLHCAEETILQKSRQLGLNPWEDPSLTNCIQSIRQLIARIEEQFEKMMNETATII